MTDAALTEQLNGLIDLLQAVGIDSVNKREIKKASLALKNQGSGAPIVFPSDVPEAKQLNDDQIQAMILKLQQAKAEAPNLMEAMQDYVDSVNGVTSTRGKKKKKKNTGGPVPLLAPSPKEKHLYPQHQASQPVYEDEEYEEEEYEEEPPQNDHDDYDEEEDDDDFDEDADYPMVGPGVSDDCSVVSDMTTPTVVSSIHVHDEEHYEDMLPSMYSPSGGGPPMMIQPPKRKNLVSQVGRSVGGGVPMRVGPQGGTYRGNQPVGAAAKRRQTYQQTMNKLQQNPYGSSVAGPAANRTVPTISEDAEAPLSNQSGHSNDFSFASGQGDWQPFADQPQEGMDNSGSQAKPKKKGTKGTKKGSTSPKPKKKKSAAGTSIDKTGFPAEGTNGQLSKSSHSSTGGKKKVKKKMVKKPSGDHSGAAPPKKKSTRPKATH